MPFSLSGTLGASKEKGKTKSQTTNVLDGQYKDLVYGNVDRTVALGGALTPYSGERVAGFNDNQFGYFDGMRAIQNGAVGAGTLNNAISQASQAAAYTPERVSTQKLSEMDLSPYMDSYLGNVVDTTNADLARQRTIENLQNDSRATQSGAFGGTGAEVARSLTGDNYARAMATSTANLRSQGHQNAQNMGLGDLARRLSADQANQNAGLQANQTRLSAAGILGQLSDQELNQSVSRAGLLRTIGDAQQAQQQRVFDTGYQDWNTQQERLLALQNLINSSIGLVPQTGTTYGTNKSQTTQVHGKATGTYESG